MRVVAGCDGGGTKCTVRVVAYDDSGAVASTGQATAGSANVRSNPDLALDNVRTAMARAVEAAKLPADTVIESFVAALAGAGNAEQRGKWKATLSDQLLVRDVRVIADVEALFAAVELPADVAAIALVVGTGSIAWARFPSERMQRAGGLGPKLGDEGSGYWIGSEAIQKSYEAGSESSQLREKIAARFRNRSMAELHQDAVAHRLVAADVARLSADVFGLVGIDELATRISCSAARHVTELLCEVSHEIASTDSNPIPWVAAGGVAVNQPDWLASVRQQCRDEGVYLAAPELVREPVLGATRLARDFL